MFWLDIPGHFQVHQKAAFVTTMSADKLTTSYLHVRQKLPLIGRTVGQQLYVAADKYKDKEMYVFYADNERISFQQMKEKVYTFCCC